ncbi:MAG TPA: hypothetical protein VE984_04990 [Gaiellaceae bacterium]|nr:hypothetical protein [Gaiellaceae bacterium]
MQEPLVPGAHAEQGDVRGWNGQVRRLADMFPAGVYHIYGFACECGCGQIVAMTAAAFDATGAWVDGHKPA